MAVVRKNHETGEIETCSHIMSGKPRDVAFDYTYSVPVDDKRQAFLEEALGDIFQGKDIMVEGQPWDYALSDSPELHEKTMAGHYRVSIEGVGEKIVYVNNHNVEEAVALGAKVFEAYKEEGILVEGAIELPDGKYSQKVGDVFIHIQDFVPNAKALDETIINGKHKDIGRMVGRMRFAALMLSDDTKVRLHEFTDDTTMHLWKTGLAMVKDIEHDSMDDVVSQDQKEAFKSALNDVPALQDFLENGVRNATSFNMIEKRIKVDPKGRLIYDSCDTPSRGYVPMLTDNATYDVGVAMYRIIMNESLYEETGAALYPAMKEGIESFVKGYNEHSSRSTELTVDNALEAAQIAIKLQMLTVLGSAQAISSNDIVSKKDLIEHVVTSTIPSMQRIDTFMQRYNYDNAPKIVCTQPHIS